MCTVTIPEVDDSVGYEDEVLANASHATIRRVLELLNQRVGVLCDGETTVEVLLDEPRFYPDMYNRPEPRRLEYLEKMERELRAALDLLGFASYELILDDSVDREREAVPMTVRATVKK